MMVVELLSLSDLFRCVGSPAENLFLTVADRNPKLNGSYRVMEQPSESR